MRRTPIVVAALLALLECGGSAFSLQRPSPESGNSFLDRYCVTCHNQRLAAAGLPLDLVSVNDAGQKPDVWEKVVHRLRSGTMPPQGSRQPDRGALERFMASLESTLDQAAIAKPNPGRAPMRRLNRAEYTNAIRDLLSVEIDGPALLPADDAGYGFDNIADLLSISPSLMSRYLSAAQKIARLTFPADQRRSPPSTSFCHPRRVRGEEPCARRILTKLARRAYRRPVQDRDVEDLLAFYRQGRSDGGFALGMQTALKRLLVDPEFIFRIEPEATDVPAGTAYRVSPITLASRLSFFVWSSIPDEELLRAAESGQLRDAETLERQVRRMLADTRSNALVDNFAAQWVNLRRMETVTPNPVVFPEFDADLRDALVRETRLFLESQFRADRSVLELLTANYTFVNERLARHYGIPDVRGSEFRRVTFDDGTRGGLLGQGSVLTVTSYAHRTSPVVRGKWLLTNVFGDPPPPPPDVPELAEFDDDGRAASIREQLESHRRNPACANCHARMDPLGLALEHFDAIGRWRDVSEGGGAVDASGALPDGTRLDGLGGLRRVVADRRDDFVKTFAEKLLTYALGRGLEPSDAPVIRAVVRAAAHDDGRWSSIILAIVRSPSFQMRMRPPVQLSPPAP